MKKSHRSLGAEIEGSLLVGIDDLHSLDARARLLRDPDLSLILNKIVLMGVHCIIN